MVPRNGSLVFNELSKKEAVGPDAARTGPDDAVH
jgi:hypothetical protein